MRIRHFPGSGLLFDLASQRVDSYARETPVLDLKDYLEGPVSASGLFIGLSGHVQRRFTIEITGRWSGSRGRLEERCRYDDGETGERIWEMVVGKGGTLTATAGDVLGAAKGAQSGNAAAMRYRLQVPRRAGETVVRIEDWFYLMEDGTLINRARMSWFGLKVGEIVACFRRDEAAAPPIGQP